MGKLDDYQSNKKKYTELGASYIIILAIVGGLLTCAYLTGAVDKAMEIINKFSTSQ